jgi:hypothetical protein
MRVDAASFMPLLLSLAAAFYSPDAPAVVLSCGTSLHSSVRLTADVVCGPGQDGLIVIAPNVRINLNGHSVIGQSLFGFGSTTGIRSSGFERVEIVGPGTVTGFDTPIVIDGGLNHRIIDVSVPDLWSGPISVRNSSGSVIERNRFAWLEIVADPGNSATANRIIGNEIGYGPPSGGGISLRGCNTADNMVADNAIQAGYSRYSQPLAISLDDGANANQFLRNKISQGAILLGGVSNNMFAGNTIEGGLTNIAVIQIYSSNHPVACAGGALLPGNNNIVKDNRIQFGLTAVWIGFGVGTGTTTGNVVTGNTFSDQMTTAIFFTYNANGNDGRGNTYVNVPTKVLDFGTGNLWP